jgi:hypothetical protein
VVQYFDKALPLAVQGLLAVVPIPLIRAYNTAKWKVLYLVTLHLHVDPFLLRISVKYERRDGRHGLGITTPIDDWQRRNTARRLALVIRRTDIQELTIQSLELLRISSSLDHLQVLLVSW